MATTRQEIEKWFDSGVEQKKKYLVVVCDRFDFEDYPVYCATKKEAMDRIRAPGDMQRVMECYDLESNKTEQLLQHRCWALTP